MRKMCFGRLHCGDAYYFESVVGTLTLIGWSAEICSPQISGEFCGATTTRGVWLLVVGGIWKAGDRGPAGVAWWPDRIVL
jgi:hypothetical protein